jgi:hypothetical protein
MVMPSRLGVGADSEKVFAPFHAMFVLKKILDRHSLLHGDKTVVFMLITTQMRLQESCHGASVAAVAAVAGQSGVTE